jgi:predicted Zn-dependent protease
VRAGQWTIAVLFAWFLIQVGASLIADLPLLSRAPQPAQFRQASALQPVQERIAPLQTQRQRLAEAAAKTLQATTGEAPDAALSQASAQIYARGLDKSSEFEADRLGAELMTRAGYDPAAAVGVLERLQRLKGDDPRAELLFSTHPSPAERLDTLLQSGLEGLPRPAQDAITLRSARFAQLMSNL